MATFTHSRSSSSSSTSSTSSSYRLFPPVPKCSTSNHQRLYSSSSTHQEPSISAFIPHSTPPQCFPRRDTGSSKTFNFDDHHYYDEAFIQDSAQLTASIERTTLPMLEHLNQQYRLTCMGTERERVRRQIERQETLLTLSMLLKVWGEDGHGNENRCGDHGTDDESR